MARRPWLTCFVPHRLELVLSPSWREAPKPLRRILERVEIEHMRHGTLKNGELFVAYSQFVDFGISRRSILSTLDLGQALGLIEVIRSEDAVGDLRAPNAYRLTYVPAKGKKTPTDEWKSIPEDRVKYFVDQFRMNEKAGSIATGKEAA